MTSGRKAGRAYVELGVDDQMTRGLQRAQAKLRAFGDGLKAIGGGLLAVGGGTVAALTGAAAAFATHGSAVLDMSRRTGVAVEALQALQYAAAQDGVEIGALESGLRRMQKTAFEAANGSESAAEALELLGVRAEDLLTLRPEEQFALLGDRIARIEDPAMKAGVAMEVFGRGGTALLPMLKDGATGLADMTREARDLNIVMSAADAHSAHALGDAWTRAKAAGAGLLDSIGAALAPMLTDIANAFARAVAAAIQFVRDNQDLIVTVFKVGAVVAAAGAALMTAGTAVVAVGALLGGLAAAFSAVVGVVGALGAVLGALLSPVGLVVAGVIASAGALVYFSGAAEKTMGYAAEQFEALKEDGTDALAGIRDALMAGDIKMAAEIMWQGVRIVWIRFTSGLSKMWTNWVHDMAGALSVIASTAAEVFDQATTTGADWITQASHALGVNGLVLGVDLNDSEVSQASDALRRAQDQRSKDREQALQDQIAAIEASRQAELDAADKELADARARLKDLAAQAANARERKERRSPGDTPTMDPIGVALAGVPAAVEAAMTRIATGGTFNASALQSLQASSNPIQRVAKATERTAENTTRLVGMARQGGVVFEE
jgi:hypothetical protein